MKLNADRIRLFHHSTQEKLSAGAIHGYLDHKPKPYTVYTYSAEYSQNHGRVAQLVDAQRPNSIIRANLVQKSVT